MVDLLKEEEATPVSYPNVTLYLRDTDPSMHPFENRPNEVTTDHIWQRIEAYTSVRYSAREVIWTIEGEEGDTWAFPLAPVNSFTAEKWGNDAWVSVTLPEAPLGRCLPSDGTFRITAQVGGGTPPEAVQEAIRRMHDYSISIVMNEPLTQPDERFPTPLPTYAARAIQLSGAGDLLRPFKRQK